MNIYIFKLEPVSLFSIFIFCYVIILNKSALLANSIDSLTRIDLNLPYYNSIYFLWTNLDYIYLYFIGFILFTLLLSLKLNYLKNYIVLIPFLFMFITWVTLYAASTSIYTQFNDCNNSSNLLLFNSINKYHPLLLYVSAVTLMFLVVSCLYPITIYKKRHYFNKIIVSWVTILITITSTMYAGSWWAYQEGSWGGWWAWDSSETFGLLILLLLVWLVHLNFFSKKIRLVKSYYYATIIIILLNYLLLQLNFGITSHNFGLKDSSDSTVVSYYVNTVLTLFIMLILGVYSYKSNLLHYSFIKRPKIVFNYYIFILIIPIFASIAPLLTDLLWKTYEINTVNFNSNYYLLSSLLVATIFQWFNYVTLGKLTHLTVFVLVLLSDYPCSLLLITLFSVSKLTKFSKIHLSIFIYLYISWASNNYIVNCWISDIYYNATTNINLNLFKHPLLVKSWLNTLYDSTYSILSDSSTALNTGVFILKHDISEYQQIFLSDSTRVNLISKSFDDLTFFIPLCSYLLFSYIYRLLRSGYIIKC